MIKEYVYNQLNEAMFFGVESINFSKMSDEHVLVKFHKDVAREDDILLDESRVISPKLYQNILDFINANSYVKKDGVATFTKFKLQSPERKYTISCEYLLTDTDGFQALKLIPIKKVHTATVSS